MLDSVPNSSWGCNLTGSFEWNVLLFKHNTQVLSGLQISTTQLKNCLPRQDFSHDLFPKREAGVHLSMHLSYESPEAKRSFSEEKPMENNTPARH